MEIGSYPYWRFIKEAFVIYSRLLSRIIVITLVTNIPTLFMTVTGISSSDTISLSGIFLLNSVGSFSFSLLWMFFNSLEIALLTLIVCQYYSGQAINLKQAAGVCFKLLPRLFILSLLVNLSILGAATLLLIPGLFIALSLSLSSQSVIIERKSVLKAMTRSYELSGNNRLFLAAIWGFMIVTVLSLNFLLTLVTDSFAASGSLLMVLITQGFPKYIFNAIVSPFASILLSLTYFRLCIRKASIPPVVQEIKNEAMNEV